MLCACSTHVKMALDWRVGAAVKKTVEARVLPPLSDCSAPEYRRLVRETVPSLISEPRRDSDRIIFRSSLACQAGKWGDCDRADEAMTGGAAERVKSILDEDGWVWVTRKRRACWPPA